MRPRTHGARPLAQQLLAEWEMSKQLAFSALSCALWAAGAALTAVAEEQVRPRGVTSSSPRPRPEVEGNWYVLREGQTDTELARTLGIERDGLDERFQRVDPRWFDAVRRDIAQRFPDIEQVWGGRVRLPQAGIGHTVEDEDIWALSRRFKTSAIEILIVNGWDEHQAKELRAGQRILIPGVVRSANGEIKHLPRPASKQARTRAERLGLGSRAAAGAVLRGALSDEWIAAAGGETGSGTFAWPVFGGWRVRGFGSGKAGYHKAIDIGGKIGWPARAADEGVVAYAGDGVRGYGKVAMILHKGRFATFYAHLSELFVSAGERVMRAEIIGEIGSTGISRGPHLHFELIHHQGNCDPEPLFRPWVRGVEGQRLEVEQARWDGRGSPPPAVRCERRPSHHPDSRWK
jgi:murein DD-endopeptidase MepM/ murein hydrolase activator NlpD